MQPLVQSAIDAANRGENNKAMEFLKQALAVNPNDVDAWLVVAAIVEQPERKRQCLNRVLTLDPTNQLARDELLDMDRAAMGGTPSLIPEPTPPQPIYQSASPPPSYPTSTSAFEPEPATSSQAQVKAASSPSQGRTVRTQVFKYSLVTRIMVYLGVVFSGLLTLMGLVRPEALCVPCAVFLIMLPVIWIVSAEVELSEKGIRASRLFGLTSAQVSWNEIASIKSRSSSLDLTTKKGNRVKITSQIGEYPLVIETLRQKRPDLFGIAAPSPAQENAYGPERSEQAPASSSGSSTPVSTPAFSGTKIFRKSFFRQYIITFTAFFFCLLFGWGGFSEPEGRTMFFLLAGVCVLFMILPLFQVNTVKVEPNRITIETLFEQKVHSARQIKEIKMQAIRGRYGKVTNILNITPVEGRNYPLQGFSDGDEFIYGFLMNWWNAYRSR
jgi:hypothetical protein